MVKFRRGLYPQIQNAVVTMANRRPSDTAPTTWYEAARNVDQNRASNEAFRSAYHTPVPNLFCPPAILLLPLKPPSVQAQVRPTPGHPITMEVDANQRKALVPLLATAVVNLDTRFQTALSVLTYKPSPSQSSRQNWKRYLPNRMPFQQRIAHPLQMKGLRIFQKTMNE